MLRKGLAVAVILLFVGVAVAPNINADVKEQEIVEPVIEETPVVDEDCGCEEDSPKPEGIWPFPVICMFLFQLWQVGYSIGGMFGLGICTIMGGIASSFGCSWLYNNPPDISPIEPVDGEINVLLSLSELRFQISDSDDLFMRYIVTTSPDIGSGGGINKLAGIYSIPISGLEESTEYTWQVEVTDGWDTTIDDYSFTTASNAPDVSNPYPYDDAEYIPNVLSELSFHLKVFQGEPFPSFQFDWRPAITPYDIEVL